MVDQRKMTKELAESVLTADTSSPQIIVQTRY